MKNCGTPPQPSVLEHVEWKITEDASGPILRKAADAAVLQDRRLNLHFDPERGEYQLAIAAGR